MARRVEDGDEPDYPALVERELRIAAILPHVERLAAEVMALLADESRRQRYTR